MPRLPLLLSLLLMPLVVGCGRGAQVKAGPADSPTGGVALLFDERIPDEQRFRRYELSPDGTLAFGGGKAALLGRTDWSTPLTAAQLAPILEALRGLDLLEREPACAPDAARGRVIVRIDLATPQGSVRRDLEGPCPDLAPLAEALHAPTLVRFDRAIEALPEAGPRPAPRR